jgi:hypothetical protein
MSMMVYRFRQGLHAYRPGKNSHCMVNDSQQGPARVYTPIDQIKIVTVLSLIINRDQSGIILYNYRPVNRVWPGSPHP